MLNIPIFAGFGLIALLTYKYFLYPLFLSPLSKIPSAHFSSSISPLWILYKRCVGAENRSIHAAHLKHGPIVKLAPDQVSVNCVDGGIKTIYSGGFEKSNWYHNMFDNYGAPCLFSMTENRPHSIQKRMISNVYSKTYLQSSPDLHKISQVMIFDRLLPILEAAAKNKTPTEVLGLSFAAAGDFINAYLFGLSNSTNWLQDVHTREHWLHKHMRRQAHRFWPQELPGVATFLDRFGIHLVPKWVDALTQDIEAYNLQMCKAAGTFTKKPQSEDEKLSTAPVVYKQLSSSLTSSSKPPSSPKPVDHTLTIASELLDHSAAGFDTSGITLTYLLYRLSQNLSLQAFLRAELLTLSPPLLYPPTSPISSFTYPELPSPKSLAALPLLHACLIETLRLHAVIPGPQPRITPHHPPISLAGSPPLPGGFRVSAQAYSLHRNEAVFPNAEEWKPERWMVSDEEKKEMTKWFWAFGSGGRMCVGSNFATQELLLIAAAIYTNYRTHIIDDEGIEAVDAYTTPPKAGRLVLGFTKAEQRA